MRNIILCLILLVTPAAAQNLTPQQKEADFRYLASLFQMQYAPLDWKKQLFGFDALNVRPWLDRAAATKTDIEFYELCVEYIYNLQDTHVSFSLPSDFLAQLGFGVDIYDGAPLIESINRVLLPANRYPFGIGDRLISVDGEDALALTEKLARYYPQGNPRASLRQGAARLASRSQSRIPSAPNLGASATVVIRRQSGVEETYTIPWTKTGTPLVAGPVPSPKLNASKRRAAEAEDFVAELQNSSAPQEERDGLLGYGARNPVFLAGLPSTFTRRLGGLASDFFYSGVFQSGSKRIGYIRIPNYSPPNQATALTQFETEITFMNANTDGLIIDEMRNTGGNLCFGEEIVRRLTPYEFQATAFELRAYWGRVLGFYNLWINAVNTNQTDAALLYQQLFKEMLAANQEGKVATRPLPICNQSSIRQPVVRPDGSLLAYTKPLMVIIDDFSTSTADSVPSMLQDSGRAVLFGMRSNGAGGNNIGRVAGVYSEGFTGMTIGLQSRPKNVSVEGFPTSRYSENTGVRPDIVNDYMTAENLLRNGAPFIAQFLAAMNDLIDKQPR